MPKRVISDRIDLRKSGGHFCWRLRLRNGKVYADGRSGNGVNLGQHSLGCSEMEAAIVQLRSLDLRLAVHRGLIAGVAPVIVNSVTATLLDEGVRHYVAYVARATVTGGTRKSTQARYRAVLDKFVPFAKSLGVSDWAGVTKRTLTEYQRWLENHKKRSIRTQPSTLNYRRSNK